MSCIHLFNCDNDLALANFSPGFTPPATIRQMMEELAELPAAWETGSEVPPDENLPHGQADDTVTSVSVWGWSPAVCHRLRHMGVPESLLPTQTQLQEIRRLSSRERAVELLRQMRDDGVCAAFDSLYCTDEAQVDEALSRWPRTILKAPWSGSGKGLRYGQGGREDTLRGWYQRIIQQQGGVVVEPLYDKLHDLAMEFWSDGAGCVSYQGLSLFDTHPNGAYRGNLLMPEAEKQAWLDRFIPSSQSLAVRQWLEQHLGRMIGTSYRGYLGVDMMLVTPPSSSSFSCYSASYPPRESSEAAWAAGPILHPMVEINLRMTMGMVSILLQRRLQQGGHGVFRLDYFARPEDMLADNAQRQASSPQFQVLCAGPHYRAYIE